MTMVMEMAGTRWRVYGMLRTDTQVSRRLEGWRFA